MPIAEAMLALVLMDHYLRHRAQNADVALRDAGHPGLRAEPRAAAPELCGASPHRPVRSVKKRRPADRLGAVPAVGYSYVQFTEVT